MSKLIQYLSKGMTSLENGRPDIATAYALMVIAALMMEKQDNRLHPEPAG